MTARIADKFKSLRMCLKRWQMNVSELKLLISKSNHVVFLLDELEEWRPLFRQEINFRRIVKSHLEKLLHLQFLYWKKEMHYQVLQGWRGKYQIFPCHGH